MLNLYSFALTLFNDDVFLAMGTSHLPVKLGNDDEGQIHIEETFFFIEAIS